MEKNILKFAYEPKRENQWILDFPNDFHIPEYCISKVSAIKYSSTNGWENITITLLDLNMISISRNLIENLVQLPWIVILKKLDSTGVCIETIEITSKEVDINYGKFDYASDKLSKIKIILKPDKIFVQ